MLALHLNDSKAKLGSCKDRHEHIGAGEIGRDAFEFIVNDERLEHLPLVIEAPKGKTMEEDEDNLTTLRGMVR